MSHRPLRHGEPLLNSILALGGSTVRGAHPAFQAAPPLPCSPASCTSLLPWSPSRGGSTRTSDGSPDLQAHAVERPCGWPLPTFLGQRNPVISSPTPIPTRSSTLPPRLLPPPCCDTRSECAGALSACSGALWAWARLGDLEGLSRPTPNAAPTPRPAEEAKAQGEGARPSHTVRPEPGRRIRKDGIPAPEGGGGWQR